MKSYAFQRTHRFSIDTNSSGVATYGSMTFALSDVPSYTDFTELFERYQLKSVAITIIPRTTENEVTTSNPGLFVYAIDLDDAITLPEEDFQQRQGVQYRNMVGKQWKIYIKPRFQTNIYNGVVDVDAHTLGRRGAWISTSNPSVPHYGLKWMATATSAQKHFDVVVKYYFVFNGVT